MTVLVTTHHSVEFDQAEVCDILLQQCQVSFAAVAQFAFDSLSGVHGVLHSFAAVSQPLLVRHEGFMKLLDLIQQLYNRIRGVRNRPKTKRKRSK